MAWEIDFLLGLQKLLELPLVKEFTVLFTKAGNGGFIWLCILAFLLYKKDYKTSKRLFLAVLLGVIVSNGILKHVFQRVRPCDVYPFVEMLIERPTDFSFPSGHTTNSFACAFVLSYCYPKYKWGFLALACFIAFSRMLLFVHFPTDIMGGMLIGITAGYTSISLFNYFEGKDGAC